MLPWFWFWAPTLQFPFGGSVAQNIAPDTEWFFGSIKPQAGNGATEQRIHEDVASYGRQLGLLSEVLLSLAGDASITPEQARASLARLQEIRHEIEALKSAQPSTQQQLLVLLGKFAEDDPAACAQLLQGFALAHPRLAAPRSSG
jgi:hypothetical protein